MHLHQSRWFLAVFYATAAAALILIGVNLALIMALTTNLGVC